MFRNPLLTLVVFAGGLWAYNNYKKTGSILPASFPNNTNNTIPIKPNFATEVIPTKPPIQDFPPYTGTNINYPAGNSNVPNGGKEDCRDGNCNIVTTGN